MSKRPVLIKIIIFHLLLLLFKSFHYNKLFIKRNNFSLFVSKHRASYGSFIDRLDPKKVKKIDNFQKTLKIDINELKEEEEISKYKSGDK